MPNLNTRLTRLEADVAQAADALPLPPSGFILDDVGAERHAAWFASLTPEQRDAVRQSRRACVVDFRTEPC